MKVRMVINGLTPLQKGLLKSDFEHTKWILYDEMHKTIAKMKGDRGLQFKVIRMLSGITAFSRLSVQSMTAVLETMESSNIDLFTWSLSDVNNGTTVAEIYVDDIYFDIFKMMPLMGSIIKYIGDGKDAFIRKVEKSLRESYTDDFKIERVGG